MEEDASLDCSAELDLGGVPDDDQLCSADEGGLLHELLDDQGGLPDEDAGGLPEEEGGSTPEEDPSGGGGDQEEPSGRDPSLDEPDSEG